MTEESTFAYVRVVVAGQGKQIDVPARDIYGLSTQEVASYLAKQLKDRKPMDVAIVGRNGSKFFPPREMNLASFCLDLFRVPFVAREEDRPEFYLELTPAARDFVPTIKFKIPVVGPKAQIFYISEMELEYPAHGGDVVSKVAECHVWEQMKIRLLDCTGTVADEIHPAHFAYNLLLNRYFVQCHAGARALKRMRERVDIMNEFIETERSYLAIAEGFTEHVEPIFKVLVKNKCVKQEDVTALLNAAQVIAKLHSDLFYQLTSVKLDYMMPMGRIFVKYAPYFRQYFYYVQTLKGMNKGLNAAILNPHFSHMFHEFEDSDYAKGIRFDGVCISPVQRGPRVTLLMAKTLEYTDSSHPDFEYMKQAVKVIDDTVKSVEADVAEINAANLLAQLAPNIVGAPGPLIESNRNLRASFTVQFKVKYQFIFFSDVMWITKVLPDKKLEFKKSSSYDSMMIEKYGKSSILLRKHDEAVETDLVYRCADSNVRDELIHVFRRTSLAAQDKSSDLPRVVWEKFTFPPKIKNMELENHCIFSLNNVLFLYGGTSPTGEILGSIRMVEIAGMKVRTRKYVPMTDPLPRSHFAHAFHDKKLYIWGGTVNGVDPLGDFWVFDTEKVAWTRLKPAGDVPPPDYGLTLTAFEDCLVLVGGRQACRVHKYVISENSWQEVKHKSGFKPATLDGHNTFAFGKTGLIVIGGDPVNLRVFLLKNFGEQWVIRDVTGLYPCNLRQRAGRIGNRLVVFGDDKTDSTQYLVDIQEWHWMAGHAEGVKPLPEVRNYAVCEGDNCIWFHGGVSKFKNMEQTLYRVTIREPQTVTTNFSRPKLTEDRFIRSILENPNHIREEKWT